MMMLLVNTVMVRPLLKKCQKVSVSYSSSVTSSVAAISSMRQ